MKNKVHKITGVFKNIPGKGIGESHTAKQIWYKNNLKYDFICCQEAKTKTKEEYAKWFPLNWHDNIYCSLHENADTAHGGVTIAINPHSDLKYVNHLEIEEGRALLINLRWRNKTITIVNLYLHSGELETPQIIKDRNKLLKKLKNNTEIKKSQTPYYRRRLELH